MAQVYPEPPVTQSTMDVQAGAVPVAVPIDPTNGAPIAAVPAFTNSMDMTAMFAHDAISVQQTRRGCFQEMCGCEAKSEYRVFAGHVEEGQPRAEGIPQALKPSVALPRKDARRCLAQRRQALRLKPTVALPRKDARRCLTPGAARPRGTCRPHLACRPAHVTSWASCVCVCVCAGALRWGTCSRSRASSAVSVLRHSAGS